MPTPTGVTAWPTAVIDTADQVVKPGDATNNATRVNVVTGSLSVLGTTRLAKVREITS